MRNRSFLSKIYGGLRCLKEHGLKHTIIYPHGLRCVADNDDGKDMETQEDLTKLSRQEIAKLRAMLQAGETPLEKLIKTYRNNVWALKEITQRLPAGEEKSLHERAFDTILAEKGSWIGYGSKIPQQPIFPHGILGIFISGSAVIGKNAVIYQHVTIGSNALPDSKGRGAPTIGDNVYIGTGAKIIGNVKIGNNCRIGANAVVTFDIPDNSVVVMEKPRVIHKENMDNKFYEMRNGQLGYRLDGQFVLVERQHN